MRQDRQLRALYDVRRTDAHRAWRLLGHDDDMPEVPSLLQPFKEAGVEICRRLDRHARSLHLQRADGAQPSSPDHLGLVNARRLPLILVLAMRALDGILEWGQEARAG